ncbi:MAG: hypothetical protein GFH27_549409n7 [Chloroflexi bacterium AL-W]|nr:hypothetical protein [Chloroflexi bacterium AL-N1]NOK71342.1 hypothetical protein [Chloroflexi bacterium AL-N10]NOK78745.1 hypothetical protein [Chloroflexi bacterium AL-N5]NOK86115.1 hypothetical protein [Chloroflexi bacterium AL-W]NOK93068.1 hypothetical protein [Chloroflexi bacterium AL-N15]
MSDFDVFRFSFRDSSAERKLAVLRMDSLIKLSAIRGYAELLHRFLEKPETCENPDELKEWASRVSEMAQFVHDLTDALTASQNREGRGLPELRPYDSLLDAIRDISQKLSLPLAEALDDTSRIFIHSQYPLVLLDEPRYHRKIAFALDKTGYSVELLTFAESRMFEIEGQVLLSNLEDAATVIDQWLLEQRTANDIQRMYPSPEDRS